MFEAVLNPPQWEAVRQTEGPVLILAGAGSGKTRVLTHRIAYLIQEKKVPAWQILALTFTNKAAREMKSRILSMLSEEGSEAWIFTFHSLCMRILRRDAERIGLTRDFVLYDGDDQKKVVTNIIKSFDLNDKYYPPRDVLHEISAAKDQGWDSDGFRRHRAKGDFRLNQIADIYQKYQANLNTNGALDFDDLILKTLELFRDCPDVLAHYAERFRYVHVDEYQDTNHVQYLLVQQLCGVHHNLCVVGDDDQSIYSWRGADIRNILDFEKDYPDAFVVRLEQNYRSVAPILQAANHVIMGNLGRKEKKLWTAREGGDKITLHVARDELAEADYVAQEVYRMVYGGRYQLQDVAVLYRTHAQSRVLEAAMTRSALPYRVYGGQKFYDRAEVRDALAYLRLLRNPLDDVAFSRIVNLPRRGLGDVAIAELQVAASTRNESLMLCAMSVQDTTVSARVQARILPFANTMRNLMLLREDMEPGDFMEKMLADTGLLEMFQQDVTPEGQTRVENLKELVAAVYEFQRQNEHATMDAFLDNVALVSDIDSMEETPKNVTLMTLHAAKGLEFPVVFLVGLEEGVFPHSRSLEDQDQMQEECRLCYVGMTRGMDKLYLTRACRRQLYNNYCENPPARFLEQIPREVLELSGEKSVPRPQKRNSDGWQSDDDWSRESGSGSGYGRSCGNGNNQSRSNSNSRGSGYGGNHEVPRGAPRAGQPSWSGAPQKRKPVGVGSTSGNGGAFGNGSSLSGGAAFGGSSSFGDRSSSGNGATSDNDSSFGSGTAFGKPSSHSSPGLEPSVIQQNATGKLFEGARVEHAHFGRGRVVTLSGSGLAQTASVAFDGRGVKQLAVSMAPMRVLEEQS